MSENIVLPALGESVTEGTVTRWLKEVGEEVAVDEPLLEVSTDKVDTEIPSPVSGVLEEILVEEDETVEVGAVLARVGDGSGAAAPADEPEAETPAPKTSEPEPEREPESGAEREQAAEPESEQAAEPEPAPEPVAAPSEQTPASAEPEATESEPKESEDAPSHDVKPTGAAYVTPIVRKLANESGVDLTSLVGTGVGGRIRKEDVEAAIQDSAIQTKAQATPAAPSTPAAPAEISPLRGTTTPTSRLRKVISERAVASLNTTAQLTTMVEVDVTKVASLRNARKDEFFEKTGSKLSFLPFFAVAAAEALRTYPVINASLDGDNIVYPATENLSIAVDTERGLLAPVLRDAGEKNIAEISGEIADLADRTRKNKLTPDELADGTFTLTNTGSRGALFDTPLVFLPQAAILGTGVVFKKPSVVSGPDGDAIAIRSAVYLALSYDHRIIDGADAARFLTQMKSRLEEGNFEGNLGI